MAGRNFVYAAGGVYDLPAAEAEEYIRLGRAEKVEEKKVNPVTVQEVKAVTRPVRKRVRKNVT